jgi:protein-L-isoaspartate O-methyltransferase
MRKVTVGFALDEIPLAWREVLAPGTVIVAPLRDGDGVLRLCRTVLHEGNLEQEWGHEVSYVPVRTAPPAPRIDDRGGPSVPTSAPASPSREVVHLPVLD